MQDNGCMETIEETIISVAIGSSMTQYVINGTCWRMNGWSDISFTI